MAKQIFFKKKGASPTVEYMALIVFILAAFYLFQDYIVRGFAGRWKITGDTFGYGKTFDPRPYGTTGDGGGTLECVWDHGLSAWYETGCYDDPAICAGSCTGMDQTACHNCKVGACPHADCDAGGAPF